MPLRAISMLRKALGETAGERFIETVILLHGAEASDFRPDFRGTAYEEACGTR